MWLLSCEGDLLDGKSIWLRPGSQHLLGRTSPKDGNEHIRYIEHKSISRKHLLITTATVVAGDSAQVHARSIVTLTDSSKTGTFVNGEKLEKANKVLTKTDNKIQLGTSEYIFHLKWRPVVLTFTNLPKTLKAKADPLADYRSSLEHADIKLISTYISDTTTHVVAAGRNNPACLQALAQARWTVQYKWVDELVKVVKQESGNQKLQGLEMDFDSSWPAESKYLISSDSEPVPRPSDLLLPNPQRSEVFKGLTFVFLTETQFGNLMPIIAACGGKAILQEVDPLQTSANSVIQAIKDHVRSSKTRSVPSEECLSKTVVVQASNTKSNAEWWSAFAAEVEKHSGRSLISQSDFLDAILTLDTSSVCAPSVLQSSPPVHPQPSDNMEQDSKDEPQIVSQKVNKAKRFVAQSRFKGFKDFDPSEIAREASPSPEPELDIAQAGNDPMDEAEAPESIPSKKRPASAINVDDVMEAHLSGMAAMKKQRLDNGKRDAVHNTPVETSRTINPSTRQRKDKLVNVKAKLLEQRKREEEERIRNEESLNDQLDGLTVEDMKKFVQYAELELDCHAHAEGYQTSRAASERWNPAWNGRKNFKGFRPQGQNREGARSQRVEISLEPMRVKKDGFFNDYWLESPAQGRSESQSNGHGLRQASSAGEQRLSARTTQSQQISIDGASSIGNPGLQPSQKRPLADAESNSQAAKKARTRRPVNIDDGDEELQFRRRRV